MQISSKKAPVVFTPVEVKMTIDSHSELTALIRLIEGRYIEITKLLGTEAPSEERSMLRELMLELKGHLK